jgi:hypothetical protein
MWEQSVLSRWKRVYIAGWALIWDPEARSWRSPITVDGNVKTLHRSTLAEACSVIHATRLADRSYKHDPSNAIAKWRHIYLFTCTTSCKEVWLYWITRLSLGNIHIHRKRVLINGPTRCFHIPLYTFILFFYCFSSLHKYFRFFCHNSFLFFSSSYSSSHIYLTLSFFMYIFSF